MYYAETDTPGKQKQTGKNNNLCNLSLVRNYNNLMSFEILATARTSNLNEELGQVS